jgi:hypothetical protein
MPTRLLAKKVRKCLGRTRRRDLHTQARVPGFLNQQWLKIVKKIISGRNRIFVYGQRKKILPV